MAPKPDLHSLQERGYTILPSLLPLTSQQYSTLRSAAQQITAASRTGTWPHTRTLPKQFPPWPSDLSTIAERGIWGVQHLLHPDLLPEARREFERVYFSDLILGAVREILGLEDGDDMQLVMELCNLLVRPGRAASKDGECDGEDFKLRWHRDDVSPEITGAEEERALGLDGKTGRKVYTHTQFNLSLAEGEDSSLVVVPGSHIRARTAEEVRLVAEDPWCKDMPGQMVVKLQPGDVVFYDNNILHRGVYEGAKERFTVHGSYSVRGAARDRARNVLQHGCGSWIERCTFDGLDERLRRRAEALKAGLMEMGGKGNWNGTYSLQG